MTQKTSDDLLLSVGLELKKLRQEKGCDLSEIAARTKIGLKILEKLERDDFEGLPDRTYVAGFIRSYCKALSAPSDQYIGLFHQRLANMDDTRPSHTGPAAPRAPRGRAAVVAGIFGGGAVIVVAVVMRAQSLKAPGPGPAPVSPEYISEKTPLLKKAPGPPHPPVPPSAPDPPRPPPLAPGPPSSSRQQPPPRPEAQGPPPEYRQRAIEGKQNLFIHAEDGDSWLTHKVDGRPIRKFILKKGRSLFLQGDEIRLFMGNLKATRIFLNNVPLDVPTATGVKSLVFPQQRAAHYKLPLFIFREDGSVITSDQQESQGP